MNDKPKWLTLKSVDEFASMFKRSRTSESTRNQSFDKYIGIDLNNEDPYEVPTLPMGRDKEKKKAKRWSKLIK